MAFFVRDRFVGATTLLGIAMLFIAGSPASAAADQGRYADEIAATVAEVTSGSPPVALPSSVHNETIEFALDAEVGAGGTTAVSSVSAPAEGSGPVAIEAVGGSAMTIALPSEITIAPAEVAADGTVVYAADDADTDVAVQTLEDGSVRLQTLLRNSEAPETFTYDLGGVTPKLQRDGSVVLTQATESDGSIIVGAIGAPWAVDSTGRAIETWYSLDGTSLVQHVAPDDSAAYPIVADPHLTYGWAVYINYSKTETKTFAQYTAYGTIAAGVCPFIPGFGQVAAAACVAALEAVMTSVDRTFNSAAAQGNCVQVSVPYYPTLATIALQMRWKVVTCS